MEKISKERQGEIAFLVLKSDVRKRNTPDKKEFKNHIFELSKNTGVSTDELKHFYLEILGEIYGETLETLEKIEFKRPSVTGRVGFHNYFKE